MCQLFYRKEKGELGWRVEGGRGEEVFEVFVVVVCVGS